MAKFGLTILSRLLGGISGRMMPSILPKVAEVLLQIAQTYPDPFRAWMEHLLMGPDDVCTASDDDKRDFLKTILASRHLKKYKEAVKTFSAKCRGSS